MTNITAIHEAKTVTTTSALKAASKTEKSSPIVMQSAPKNENIKELSPKQLQAKMDMEKAITSQLGFKGLFQDPYISANIKNENGNWTVILTKTKDASAFVWDMGAKQYEIEHICGRLGIPFKDLRDVEYATDRMTKRKDSSIEVGRSVSFNLSSIGKDKFYVPIIHDGVTKKAKETLSILSAK